jgi:undecaprenyl-diphosphatase
VKAVDILHVAVLALFRGATEVLPVGSSADLAAVTSMADWARRGPAVDLAVHLGALAAVAAYFWRDLWLMAVGAARYFTGRRDAENGGRLAFHLVIATLPIIAAVLLLERYAPGGRGGVLVVGWSMLGFGVLLFLADRIGMTIRRVEHLALGDAVVIGIAQVAALIPGAGRAVAAMSAARILGLERVDAARFSMLLTIPALLGLVVVDGMELAALPGTHLTGVVVMAALIGFAAALIAIAVLMAWLERSTFAPFVVYRVAVGGALLALGYGEVF